MRHLLLTICLFLSFSSLAQQDIKLKEYSYSQLFQMIEEEEDSVFRLKNAVIKFNELTDQRFRTPIWAGTYRDTTFQAKNDIIIYKHIELENVIFNKFLARDKEQLYVYGVIYDIHFKKDVILRNSSSLYISFSKFDGKFDYSLSDCSVIQSNPNEFNIFYIDFSTFYELEFYKYCQSQSYAFPVYFNGNTIKSDNPKSRFGISNYENGTLSLTGNYIKANSYLSIRNQRGSGIFEMKNNEAVGSLITLENVNINGNLQWSNNSFSSHVHLITSPLVANDEVEWNQFKDNVISTSGFVDYTVAVNNLFPVQQAIDKRAQLDSLYYDSVRYYNEQIFAKEIGLKGNFYNYYKSKYNTAVANEVYLELKDFETTRLRVLYEENKTFDAFFKWKINQFLKLFAAYGTEPARAITMSVYVVIFFAFIYLFFPNYWDSHGKDRILHRYRFFLKYLNRDAGMHDVYLEDKKDELAHYEGFKNFFIENGKTVPRFFLATALPLYRWSTVSTRGSSWLLERIDIFKGRWTDLPAPQRALKTVLLGIIFMFAILYDLFIKILNALMLSINTFTTLGFGEIPIKGLPRYLAIIQGFIGWFMLTIFSVSLISQLLN